MRYRLPVVVAAIVVLGSAAIGAVVRTREAPTRRTVLAPSSAEMTRLVRALESDARFRTETTVAPGWTPVCAAQGFGAGRSADVLYAWIYCKWVPVSASRAEVEMLGLDSLSAIHAPVVATWTPSFRYRLPEDGEGYEAPIRELFPSEVERPALDGIRGGADLGPIVDARIRLTSPRG